MGRYRDVKDVTVFGNNWTGVQEVNSPIEAENFDFSGDDQVSIRRVDVTKLSVAITITVADPQFKRDIQDPVFGASPQLALNEVMRISMNERADEIVDSSENDIWIAYVGITKRIVEAEVELRDFAQIYNASVLKIGDMARFQFDVPLGAALSGRQDLSTYERFFGEDMVVTGLSPGQRHGDLHSGTVSFRGGGDALNEAKIFNILSAGGSTVFEIHAGDEGELSFVVPSADGGSDVTVTISNVVCTGVELTATHGGRLERRFTFRAFSSDGQASPIALT